MKRRNFLKKAAALVGAGTAAGIITEAKAGELIKETSPYRQMITQFDMHNAHVEKRHYWSRAPGEFVNKETGKVVDLSSSVNTSPQFTGTVREWYETLVETVNGLVNEVEGWTIEVIGPGYECQYRHKDGRVQTGLSLKATISTPPDILTIFEQSSLYRPEYTFSMRDDLVIASSSDDRLRGYVLNRFRIEMMDSDWPRNELIIKTENNHIARLTVQRLNII